MKKMMMLILTVLMMLALGAGAGAEESQTRPEGETYVFGMLANISMTQEELNTYTDSAGFLDSYVFYDNLSSMLLDLKNGKLTGITMLPENSARYLIARDERLYYKDFQVLKGELMCSMVTTEENQKLCDVLDQAITELKEDGTLELLAQQYLSEEAVAADPAMVELPKTEGETVRVLVTGDMPPMDVVLSDGSPAGYNVALLAAMSERTGLNFECIQADAGARLAMLTSGRADVIFWVGSADLIYGEQKITIADLPAGCSSTQFYVEDRLVDVKVSDEN